MDYETLKIYNEEEISILMQALCYYIYDRPQTTQEQFDIANRLLERIETNCAYNLIFL